MSQISPTPTGDPSPRDFSQGPGAGHKRPPRPITLSDLTEDLLWPRLFRVVPLALRPDRLGIALFTGLICALLLRAMRSAAGPEVWDRLGPSLTFRINEGLARAAEGSFGGLLASLESWFTGTWWPMWRDHPLSITGCLVGLAAAIGIGGGAIARACAVEFSHGAVSPWTRVLAFSFARGVALTSALISPLIVAGVICGGLALGGWVLLNWPGVNVLGAVLYGLFLLAGLVAVLLLFGFALGGWMVVPAVVCEGTDAIDGLQRMYAYVIGRPLRLVLYMAIGLAQVALGVAVFGTIAWWCVRLTGASAGALVGEPAAGILGGLGVGPTPETSGTWTAAAHVLKFWVAIPAAIVGAFAFSGVISTSTVVYLLMRRLVDGQDEAELWMPGMVEGTTALSTSGAATAENEDDGD